MPSATQRHSSVLDGPTSEVWINPWIAHLRGLAPSEPATANRDQGALTAREFEVLRLIAAGRSNRDIANELVISVNTVERHVNHIYTKTGLANRVELAGYGYALAALLHAAWNALIKASEDKQLDTYAVAAGSGALALAALPFLGTNLSYTDAVFETISGLTTTGSTVLVGLDKMPPGILLWRSLLQWVGGVGIIVMAVAVIAFIVFMERAQRRLLVQYPKRQVGNRMFQGDASHLPLKLNSAGVIPPIFASSLLLLPITVANFSTGQGPEWLNYIVALLGRGQPLFLSFYVAMIIFFAFFYTAIMFNPKDTADNLKKYGGFVPGIRPGERTAEYIDYVLTRVTTIGALYLALVCILPEILISQVQVPFYFGGTSLLIVVSVTMDTVAQVQGHLLAQQYEGLIKKSKLRGARR